MKWKQRILFCGITTLFVCSVVFLLQALPQVKVSSFRLTNSGRYMNYGENTAHMSAIRKRLNKSNYTSDDFSPEKGDPNLLQGFQGGQVGGIRNSVQPLQFYPSANFVNYTDKDVDYLLKKLQSINKEIYNFEKLRKMSYSQLIENYHDSIKKGKYLSAYRTYEGGYMTNWEKFHKGIHQTALYDPKDQSIDGLLMDMTNEPIIDVEMKEGGTQLKLIITFSDEGQALFKPMRHSRDYETLPDHFYFTDYERHNAEIAAFHLDKVLGFYRVPPTAGRKVNMTYDIKRLADHKLAKTFFKSPANNVCFHGACSYYCDTSHAICGNPDMLEGSFATFLPPEKIAARKTWRNPWKRSYSKHRKAYWEAYDDLCEKVKQRAPYNKGRRLLDLIDMHIFDFFQGNMDRHHYETLKDFGNNTFHLHLDNGRGFGKSIHDEMSILAPIYQCCQIRYSTFLKLAKLYVGPEKLSSETRQSLSKDSISPILTEPHLYALDRRVIKVLKEIYTCIEDGKPIDEVIIDR